MAITRRRFIGIFGSGAVAVGAMAALPPVRRLFHPLVRRIRGARSIADRLIEFAAARARLRSAFTAAGITYPPQEVLLLAIKRSGMLCVYASSAGSQLRRISQYPILAASGKLGPKLRNGDRQVPEGIYSLESLNPDSSFHVALRVGYPNELDRQAAESEGRTDLGGDIMIHGGSASIGCLAMGDDAAEELFVLTAETGIENVTIVIAPVDLRSEPLPAELGGGWRDELYGGIKNQFARIE